MSVYDLALARLACFAVTAISTGVAAGCLVVLTRKVAYLRGPRGHRGLLGHKGPAGPAGRCTCRPKKMEAEDTQRGASPPPPTL